MGGQQSVLKCIQKYLCFVLWVRRGQLYSEKGVGRGDKWCELERILGACMYFVVGDFKFLFAQGLTEEYFYGCQCSVQHSFVVFFADHHFLYRK